ncbi:MAG: helix-turn-helix transcriptional regulator [Myxococcales bacterium FL481]|nr:MAG: helix-turn-helix transcriptional regulator [Myxococcales bacterium FL481]
MSQIPAPPGSLFADTTGKARTSHPETSHAAARRAKPGSGSARMRVLRCIAQTDGLTDQEIQQRLGMRESTQRPRRVELAEAGLIETHGTRKTESGRSAQVWRVTEHARVYLAGH